MPGEVSIKAVLLDEALLGLDEFAHACAVEPDWVVRHVQAGVLGDMGAVRVQEWRFGSRELRRARNLAALERDFGAEEQLAALVVDLGEEIQRLRARLRALGAE